MIRNLKRLVPAAVLIPIMAASTLVTPAAASRPHPFFGNTLVGNSAEIVTVWPYLESGFATIGMRVNDYDSVTAAVLVPGAPSGYPTFSTPSHASSDAATGDFDGDGLEDVVSAYIGGVYTGQSVNLWLAVSDMRAGDFYMGDGYHYKEQHGGVHVPPNTYRDPCTVRLAAGNFDTTDTKEFVLVTRALATDGTKRIKLELMRLDSLTRHAVPLATAWGEEQPDDLKESQRFDVAAGDFDNDGVDEIALGGVRKRADNGHMQVFVAIYRYEGGALVHKVTSAHGDHPQSLTANGEGDYFDHVAIATGHLRPDVLTDQILFSWGCRSASWYEHVWGCGPLNNEWEFYVRTTCRLGTLTVDASGTWTIAGWGVDEKSAEIFEQVLNTCDAPWDPQWTGPSLGVAVGDLTGDGVDEVAWAALNWVRVFQVSGNVLTQRAEVSRWAPGATGVRDAVRSCLYNDPSRRVVEVADLDPRPESALVWRPELMIQDWAGMPSPLRTRVYRAATNALGEITGLGAPLVSVNDAATRFESSVSLVCGDFDGDAVRLGSPRRLFVSNVIRPEIILGAPPTHYAWLAGQEWDVNACYPNYTCLDFAAHYTKETTTGQAISTAVNMEFGMSAELKTSLEAEVPQVGSAKVEASLKATFGTNFGRTGGQESSFEITTNADAYGGDRVLAAQMSYVIWEYPVFMAGQHVRGRNIAVVVPDPAGPVRKWYTFEGWLQDNQAITHEPGNLLSYPGVIPPNPPNSALGSLWKAQSVGFQIGPFGGLAETPLVPSGSFSLTATDLTTEEQTLGFNAGLELGAKMSVEAGMPFGLVNAKAGVSAEVTGRYHADELLTHRTRVGEEVNLQATVGWLAPEVADATYTVYPFIYRAKSGVLVLDYAVTLDGPWWAAHYGAHPDPTFMMPRFFHAQKGYTLTDPTTKYASPDIILTPPYVPEGDTARVFVMVRNYSLAWQTGNLSMKLFAGDPDASGTPLTDLSGNGTFVISGGIGPRAARLDSIDFVVPPSPHDTLRIYAVVDPLGEVTELREDNNKGFGVLYTSASPPVDVPAANPRWIARLEPNAPNPFTSSTRIEFVSPSRSRTTLRIYDLAGRSVATLVDAELPAGRHTFRWEGRADDGRPLGSGVYFYQVRYGTFTGTRRMLMLR